MKKILMHIFKLWHIVCLFTTKDSRKKTTVKQRRDNKRCREDLNVLTFFIRPHVIKILIRTNVTQFSKTRCMNLAFREKITSDKSFTFSSSLRRDRSSSPPPVDEVSITSTNMPKKHFHRCQKTFSVFVIMVFMWNKKLSMNSNTFQFYCLNMWLRFFWVFHFWWF